MEYYKPVPNRKTQGLLSRYSHNVGRQVLGRGIFTLAGQRVTVLILILLTPSLLLLSPSTMIVHADGAARQDYYMTIAQGETAQFSLEVPCPSTGLRLVVYHVPPEIEVVETGTVPGTRTCPCCPPPAGCCGQQSVVYAIRSDVPGQYDVEFRVGRGDASVVYYGVAVLHVTVTPRNVHKTWWLAGIMGAVAVVAIAVFLLIRRSIPHFPSRNRSHGETIFLPQITLGGGITQRHSGNCSTRT